MIQVGEFKLTPLDLGRFKLDGGAMFGVVPRVLWEKFHPADAKNRIEMALRCLLIETGTRRILVDTGFGSGRSAKFKRMFDFHGGDDYLNSALARVGLVPGDITDVILTHLHFDHCGGSTIDKGDAPQPALPNARYYIQRRQLEHARSGFERDRASYLPEDFEPLVSGGYAEIVDGPWELVSGVDMVICDGHTPAMQLVRVSAGGSKFLYTADLIPLASQVALPWIMSYDLYPVTTLEEKRNLLTDAVEEGWTLIFEHDPVYITGMVSRDEKGFHFVEG